MSESHQHLHLVRVILDHIAGEFVHMSSIALLHDLPGSVRGEKPPRIARFIPDVFAVDVPTTITIIGEAKTETDLVTAHSRKQISAFLEFLAHQKHGILILAVPWQATATARVIVTNANRSLAASDTRVIVLDEVSRKG